MDYREAFDGYWRSRGPGENAHAQTADLTRAVLAACGIGSFLDVGCGRGQVLRALLQEGCDARGIDVSVVAVEHCRSIAEGRVSEASVLALPFQDDAFDCVVSNGCLECLTDSDLPVALSEMYRVTRRHACVRVAVRKEHAQWQQITESREWWETALFRAGFRKHPAYYRVTEYADLEQESGWALILLEKIPVAATAQFSYDELLAERDLHMDMFREAGRRSDAHIARYEYASRFIRPGDTVLDAACGLGYGTYLMQKNSFASRSIGIDSSDFAVRYSGSSYGTEGFLEFRRGELPAALGELPDCSIDFVASFETLEHVADPSALLADFRRILTPAGRLFVSVPNDWSDETGRDPNPHHLHVYTWRRLLDELGKHFIVESMFSQTASRYKDPHSETPRWLPGRREWREVTAMDVQDRVSGAGEWCLAVCMRDPLDGRAVPYRETTYETYPGARGWNVSTFARDYDNPWIVKGLVTIGHRLRHGERLQAIAQGVLTSSAKASADRGAALCVIAYRLLSEAQPTLESIRRFDTECADYFSRTSTNPHVTRWKVSLSFVLARLWQGTGDHDRAVAWYSHCIEHDALSFSPLLAVRQVDACLRLALMHVGIGELANARRYLRKGIEIAAQAVGADWTLAIGDFDHPAEYGLRELANVVEIASVCGYALRYLEHATDRPGLWWLQQQQDRLTQLREKDRAIETLAAEFRRLNEVLPEKEVALLAQASEIHRLNDVVVAKDAAASSQATEIHRLLEVISAKDAATATQAGEIHRLERVVVDKDTATSKQAVEIRRLEEVVVAKDRAVATTSEQVERLSNKVAQSEGDLGLRVREVERLRNALEEEERRLASMAATNEHLRQQLTFREESLTEHDARMAELRAKVGQRDAAIADQRAEIARLGETTNHHAASLERLKDDLGHVNIALARQQDELARLTSLSLQKDEQLATRSADIRHLQYTIREREQQIDASATEVVRISSALIAAKTHLEAANNELQALRRTKWFRLRQALVSDSLSLGKVARVAYLVAALVTPGFVRRALAPAVRRAKSAVQRALGRLNSGGAGEPTMTGAGTSGAYVVRHPTPVAANRRKVVHVIANFMTGGSSRLVVDLIENLGHRYEQSIVTSHNPEPPAYAFGAVTEIRQPQDETAFTNVFAQAQPAFIHLHYWGDCDEPWYALAMKAAEQLDISVIENVNTPVAPYESPSVHKYVYVSDYVRRVFGRQAANHVTIHPGSDFTLFKRSNREAQAKDCIGMVYRLERDKLNEQAIEPFIRVVQRRPQTRVLIVGGGSLLAGYQEAVAAAGLTERFTFAGYVSYEWLPELYRQMSVFVAPVWKESFGQVSPFAMSMRVPVIGYDVGAIGEIIGDPELLAPAADADALATIAIRLLDSDAYRAEVGMRQRARAHQDYSVEAMVNAYASLYDEVVQVQAVGA